MTQTVTNARWAWVGIVLMAFGFLGCPPRQAGEPAGTPPAPAGGRASARKEYQVLGQGPDFLTLAVTAPIDPPADWRWFILALDETSRPLDKITGFSAPAPGPGGRILFHLVLFAPRPWWQAEPLQSAAIQFVVRSGDAPVFQQILPYQKAWGGTDNPMAAPAYVPPPVLEGSLMIRDYTFRAKGDLRAPAGFHFLGRISGAAGHWTQFEPQSGLLGEEPVPEGSQAVRRGWLELRTGQAHAMQEAVSPQPPYLEGWWDAEGHFHPDTLPPPPQK